MKAQMFDFYENGYIHTRCLSYSEAEEMLERYQRIFPQHEYYYMPTEH
jgi:outer membrane protein assembly factor BamD (BamD/ComL family)